MPGSEEHPRKFRFGPYELDEAARELRKNGQSIHLQDQPWEVLRALVERPGEVISREDLRRRLWPDGTFVDYEQSLNKAVNKLREALCDSADRPRYVETLARRGYRFIAPVEQERPKLPEPEAVALTVEPAPPAAPPAPPTPAPRRQALLWLAAGGGVLAAVLATGLWPIDVPHVEKVAPLTNDTTLKQIQNGMTSVENRVSMISDGSRVLYAGAGGLWWIPATGGEPKPLSLLFPQANRYRGFAGYSPLRRQILLFRGDGLWLVGAEGESLHKIGDFISRSQVALAPDAERFAVNAPDGIYIQSIHGGERKRVHPMPGTDPVAVWWHPAGHIVGFLETPGGRSEMRAWQVNDDGTHLRRIVPEQEQEQGPGAWSQDGSRFFYTSGGEVFVRIQAGFLGWMRKAVVTRLTASGQFQTLPAVDPVNPRRLYAVGTVLRGQTMRFDLKAQSWVPFLGEFAGDVIEHSPDGQSMVYVPFPGSELHKCGIDGSGDILLTPGVEVLNPRWSPDGKRIAFVGRPAGTVGRYKLWLVSSAGGDAAPYRPEVESLWTAEWSGNGKRLLLGQQLRGEPSRRSLQILDLETGKLESMPGTENLFAAQWSPDEKQMFALDADTWHPRILDIGKGVWRLLNERRIAYPRWSRDGKYICGMQAPNSRAEAHRIEVATGRREVIARSDFNTIANLGFWLGYTQDMEPLTIRDLSSTQIYRIDLDR